MSGRDQIRMIQRELAPMCRKSICYQQSAHNIPPGPQQPRFLALPQSIAAYLGQLAKNATKLQKFETNKKTVVYHGC